MVLVLLAGCSGRMDSDRPPNSTPSAESSSNGSWPAVPPNYLTYEDDTGLFSISFPPDWQANPPGITSTPLLPGTDVVESIKSGIPLASTGSVAYLNAPSGAAWCVVQAGPLLDKHRTVEEVAAEQRDEIRQYASRIDLIQEESILVDGRESVIQELELNLGGVKTHSLALVMNYANTTWTTTCTIDTTVSVYAEYQAAFYSILGSLRITE